VGILFIICTYLSKRREERREKIMYLPFNKDCIIRYG